MPSRVAVRRRVALGATGLVVSALMAASTVAPVAAADMAVIRREARPAKSVEYDVYVRHRRGCPDRYSCMSLYGAYGPYGGISYWGAYTGWYR